MKINKNVITFTMQSPAAVKGTTPQLRKSDRAKLMILHRPCMCTYSLELHTLDTFCDEPVPHPRCYSEEISNICIYNFNVLAFVKKNFALFTW